MTPTELFINVIHDDGTITNEFRYRKFPTTPSTHQLGKNILDAMQEAKGEFPDENIALDITLGTSA